MRAGALAFCTGVLLFHGAVTAPYPGWLPAALALMAALLLYRMPPSLHWPVWGLIGFAWTAFLTADLIDRQLALPVGERADVVLDIRVADIPYRNPQRTVFLAVPLRSSDNGWDTLQRTRIRLVWYGDAPEIRPGDHWRLPVRLRPPDGFLNPAGFDYQRWLFVRRIGATGYVRSTASATEPEWRGESASFHQVRERVARAIAVSLDGSPRTGLIQGLAVAVRDGIGGEQWSVLSRTGTGHLLAISGLHIGLVAGLAGTVVAGAWRLWPALAARVPSLIAGGVAAVAAAATYAVLAGFTLPTQRALVMLTVFVTTLLMRCTSNGWHSLTVAAAAVLLIDPLAPLEAGFWLSFGAVATILLSTQNRSTFRFRLLAWLRIQTVISLALLPLLALWFADVPWVSPIANIVAIPVVGFAVVPLVLLGVGLLPASEGLAALCWRGADLVLAALWRFLEIAADLIEMGGDPAGYPWWLLSAAAVGALLLLMPPGWPARSACLMLLGSLAVLPAERVDGERVRVTVFDTGEGFTALVESGGGAVAYGLGPGGGLNGVRVALNPYWERQGRTPDAAVLPGQHDRWSGGVDDFRRRWPDVPVLESAEECAAPQLADWMLHAEGAPASSGCALTVTGPGGIVRLLPELGGTPADTWTAGLTDGAAGGVAALRSPDGRVWTTREHGALVLELTGDAAEVKTLRRRSGRPFHRHWRWNATESTEAAMPRDGF